MASSIADDSRSKTELKHESLLVSVTRPQDDLQINTPTKNVKIGPSLSLSELRNADWVSVQTITSQRYTNFRIYNAYKKLQSKIQKTTEMQHKHTSMDCV